MSIKDVADLADVPDTQLHHVLRLMGMAGFTREPLPGFVEHTTLSAGFVNRPTILDAGMFLAETAAPFALHMTEATKGQHHDSSQGHSDSDNSPAHSAAGSSRTASWHPSGNNNKQTFQAAYEQRPKLRMQWPAFFRCLGDATS